MDATRKELERRLAEKDAAISRRDQVIAHLEQELYERDAMISHLKNDIDKFRQVVRPMTRHMVSYLAEDRLEPARRQAISAEPIVGDLTINKLPKTAK